MESKHRKITHKDLERAVERLQLMKFFPGDPGVQSELQRSLASMCPHADALGWLISTLVNQVPEWPGLQSVRGLLCTRYDAADGIDAPCSIPGFRPMDYEARAYDAHQQWKSGGWVDSPEEIKRLAASADMKQIGAAKQ